MTNWTVSQGIHTLSLRFFPDRLDAEAGELLYKMIADRSSHLRCLNFAPDFVAEETEAFDLTPYWGLHFPFLESLTLLSMGHFSGDTSKSMAFWQRHPLLEKLHLCYTEGEPLFSDDIEMRKGFLPRLKHLTVGPNA
jgi:hypothetical protein